MRVRVGQCVSVHLVQELRGRPRGECPRADRSWLAVHPSAHLTRTQGCGQGGSRCSEGKRMTCAHREGTHRHTQTNAYTQTQTRHKHRYARKHTHTHTHTHLTRTTPLTHTLDEEKLTELQRWRALEQGTEPNFVLHGIMVSDCGRVKGGGDPCSLVTVSLCYICRPWNPCSVSCCGHGRLPPIIRIHVLLTRTSSKSHIDPSLGRSAR